MKKSFFAFASVVLFAASASIGCAAESEEPGGGETAGAEDDLTARQLPGVAAVEIADVHRQDTVTASMTVGAPKKVKSLVAGVKKLRPTDPVPRCMMQDTKRLTFLNDQGKKIATVDSYCAGYGHISFESGAEGYGVKFSGEVVEKAKDAPFAVGDALWAISKIELSKPGRNEKKTITGEDMKPILAGLDLDEVPDPNASFPRCLPSHAVSFIRGNDQVASTSFLCGAGEAPASLKASFTAVKPGAGADAAPLARGGIMLDPRPVIRAMGTPGS